MDEESRRIAYCEAENIKVTGPEARGVLRRVLIQFARCLSGLQYNPDIVADRLLHPGRAIHCQETAP